MHDSEMGLTMSKKVLPFILLLLLINTVLLGTGFFLVSNRLTPISEDFTAKQRMAKDLVEYNRKLAKNLGVDTRSLVRENLSRFNYEIELAANVEELNQVMLAYGSRTQEKVLQEYDTKQRETLLTLVNQDPQIKKTEEKQRITVKLIRDQGIQVEPENSLTQATLGTIIDTITLGEQAQDLTVEVEVENGRGQLTVPLNVSDQIRAQAKEIDSLRVTVHDLRTQAGYAQMSGAGIIVSIYDKTDGYTNDAIIHETDVRDTVNELFAAGARGVSIGNQRLTVTSAIRCVGPSILVNDERIPVNPVVIRAIGDPDVLASGLDIIRITLQVSRELTIEIEKTDNIALPAYSPLRGN
ncbi:MAG: DUF881 domain-containing protein [Firmicutes bacterium]|nr:DUF881 domain-containing protein [Bacillota bacterium]